MQTFLKGILFSRFDFHMSLPGYCMKLLATSKSCWKTFHTTVLSPEDLPLDSKAAKNKRRAVERQT